MKIRPKIPKFQNGGVPQWYLNRYGNRTSLLGWNSNLRYNYANQNLNANDHRNAGNLDTVYRKNMAYIGTPGAVSSDIQSFYNSDANGMSAQEFVDFYNKNAGDIRKHWAQDQTYGKESAGSHNRLFRRMFQSRSNQQESPGSDYNIGYQLGRTKGGYDIQDIEGSSTWLRRMDQYENEFDLNNPDSNRLHEITLKDGTKAIVYKKANGDIGLYNPNQQESPNNPPSETPQKPNPQPQQQTGGSTEVGSGPTGDKKETPQQGNDLLGRLRGMIPGLISTGRLAGNLINSARVYDEALKGIKPTLIQPYYTHRQVVGDEATKQAYYRRAAAGQTRAAQPFTSDADRQMAYMQEARRVGDELRAQGDLADNQEIRRTSDESNQHQWANTQRATEVANTNLASLNDANEKKHTLLAQKHSAQWSSIDNYLKEIETRKRQQMEEDNAYNKQIDLLEYENQIANDPKLKEATEKLYALRDANGNWDTSSEAYKTAKQEYDQIQARIKLQTLQKYRDINRRYSSPLLFVKSGSKITYKKDDKLLYKSTKDVVDHFRKMCRRYPDRERKIQKLAPHPGSSRKYQVGGQFLAPFTIYTPAVGLGESTRTVSQDSTGTSSKAASSSKDTSSKDILDLLKMFKDLKGVKVDVSSIYSTLNGVLQEAEIFGKELNSQQIASMYLRAMQQLNNVSRSKEIYDKAYEVAAANGALNEIAVDSVGNYAVQNKETGKIETVSKIDTSKHIPLTNSQLLTLREYRPDLAFDKGDYIMQNVVANGIGLPKIGQEIKALAGKLGNSELKLDGMSEVESNQVKQGIKLLQGAPDGHYKTTTETKNQLAQKQAAINYIMQMLPENYKAVLDIHGGAKNLIPTFLSSQIDDSQTVNFSPLTGKAAKDANGNSKENSEGLKLDAASALITGKGYNTNIELNTGSSYAVNVKARYSEFQKHSGENMGAGITMQEASTSTLKGVLDWNKATLGGSTLNSTAYNRIILNNGEVVGVDLPTKVGDKNTPDFEMLKKLEQLDDQLLIEGIEDSPQNWQKVNEICSKLQLPPKYDNQGNLNKQSWNRFAAFQVTTTEKALNDKKVILDILEPADEQTREFYENIIQDKFNDKKYSLDSGFPIFGGKEELYQGTVFVPIKNSLVAGAISSGQKISMTDATDLELKQKGYDKQKISTYKKNELVL